MKAFLAGVLAAILIAIAAHFALQALGWTTAQRFASENVRL
jgi:hypothetical protein